MTSLLKAIFDYVMNRESPERTTNSESTEGIAHFNPQLQAIIRKSRQKLADFYQTVTRLPPHALPGSFSCDWERWRNSQLLVTESCDNLSYMDKEFKSFGLKPPIRPVAYRGEEVCVVEADGIYYSFDLDEFADSLLTRLNNAPNDEMALKEFNRPGQAKMERQYQYSDYDDDDL